MHRLLGSAGGVFPVVLAAALLLRVSAGGPAMLPTALEQGWLDGSICSSHTADPGSPTDVPRHDVHCLACLGWLADLSLPPTTQRLDAMLWPATAGCAARPLPRPAQVVTGYDARGPPG